MKHFISILLTVLLSTTLVPADDLDTTLLKMRGTDYVARQEARDALFSMAADVSAAGAESSGQEAFAGSIMEALKDPGIDRQGRVFLTRILTRIGTGKTVPALIGIATDASEDPVIREHALMAVSAVPGESVTNLLIAGLKNSSPEERSLWWQAVAQQSEPSFVNPLVSAIGKSRLATDPDAWMAIGRIGGTDAARFLSSLHGKVDAAQSALLEKAILESGAADANLLKKLLAGDSNESVRTGAFGQLLERNPTDALAALREILGNKDSAIRQRAIRLALESGQQDFWNLVESRLADLSEPEWMTFLIAAAEQGRMQYEQKAIDLIDSGSPDLRIAALKTLAEIGTENSTQPLLQTMNDGDETIQDLAIYALAQVDDPQLDEQIVAQVKNPGSANREQMIRLIAIRNSDGAVDILNSILGNGAGDPHVREILNSVEQIGDVNSCRILLTRMIQDPGSPDLRNFQLSTKRLAIRLALNDHLWENAFHPALLLAPNPAAAAAVVEILDCLSSDHALDYCIDCLGRDQPDQIRDAAGAAMKRWTNINIGDYWLRVATSKRSSDSEVRDAQAAIIRVVNSKSVEGQASEKAAFGLDVLLKVDDTDFRDRVIQALHSNNALNKEFAKSISKHRSIVEAWNKLD